MKQIDFVSDDDRRSSRRASAELTRRLLARCAIPQIRWDYFADPELNIGLKCSRKEVFDRNGCKGEAIFGHGSFLSYLRYFVFGPALPPEVMEAFQQRLSESGGFISGSDCPDLDGIIRQAIRDHALDSSDAAEEFHKLALECGIEPNLAWRFRDTAKKVRR